jgi:hypothetical protein
MIIASDYEARFIYAILHHPDAREAKDLEIVKVSKDGSLLEIREVLTMKKIQNIVFSSESIEGAIARN